MKHLLTAWAAAAGALPVEQIMTKRAQILATAARLFEQVGYRGTTTRRIAREAGVSEVTLFRQFGTKDALLREALEGAGSPAPVVRRLPEHPENPEQELARWCAGYLRQLRHSRSTIRKAMCAVDERPNVIPRAATFPATASRVLREYLERADERRLLPEGFDITAAATVLAGVLFADALARDLMPDEFPTPATRAPERYVRFVLSGCASPAASVPPPRKHRVPRRPAEPRAFDRRRAEAPQEQLETPARRQRPRS